MSKESAVQLMQQLLENKQILQLLNRKGKPESKDELINIYTELARESGEDISAEDIADAFETIEEERRQKTQAAMADIIELDDEELEGVVGGDDDDRCWFNEKDPLLPCKDGIHNACGLTKFILC